MSAIDTAYDTKKLADGTEVHAIRMLGHLIRVCRDGEEGYRAAAEHSETESLREFFSLRYQQRTGFISALQTLQRRHGAEHVVQAGSLGGSIHRAWCELKGSLASATDEEIIDERRHAECVSVQTYRDILDDYPTLYPTDASVIAYQLREISRARDGLLACKNAKAATDA